MYIQRTFKNFQDETPEQRKQDMKEAKAWVRKVKNALQEQDLWKDVKYINRAEKKEDRMEKKAQNKTVENKSEVLFTEFELRKMFALTAKMMGKDAFASALSDKLHDMPQAPADMPTWETSEEMNTLLQDPDTANLIRGLVVKALPYLTVSSLEDWLTETPGEKLEAYKEKIEKKYGKKIEQKINAAFESLPSDWSLDPAATQEVSKEKLYHQVVASLAAGYMNTPSATGVGIGAAFNMDHLFIGVGISDKGNPGIAV